MALVLSISTLACGSSAPPRPTPSPSTAAATASITPASRLVDIGGRKLEILCRGSGGPVVILDAGLGNTLDVWSSVMDRLDGATTVCAYDRAGLGRSDLRPPPHGAQSAVDDLHALLGAAGLAAPYIVVGASFGGIDAQLFARRYPDEVAGVVLVDAIAAGWDDQLESILSSSQVAARRAIPNGEDMTNEDIRASERALLSAPPFPGKPLVVLRHGQPFPGDPDWPTDRVEALWKTLQDGLAALSPTSAELVATESGHRIHQSQSDLVADSIRAIIDPSRWPPKTEVPVGFGAVAPSLTPGSLHGRLWFSDAGGISVARTDGSDRSLVVDAGAGSAGEPSVDAAGRRMVFTRSASRAVASGPQPEQPRAVWTRDLVTGVEARIADDGIGPVASPDGSLVAFAVRGHTYLMPWTGGSKVDLGEGACPVWAPDSQHLAMCTNDDNLFILDARSSKRTPVATGRGPNDPTAWSPDGTRIALLSTRDGDGEIYLGADGTSERRLTTAPGYQVGGPWTSDGILVTSSAPGADLSDWFLVDPDSGGIQVIPWMHGLPNPLAWAP
jgi:pimeloyl-ACP methyl ester carboxylesterase